VKYKNIKSVAHNLGHSFLSDMNASGVGGGYTIVPELLFAAAASEQVPEARIDFIARTITPESLASAVVQESVSDYARMLFRLCADQNVDASAIRTATLAIAFDYSRTRCTKYEPVACIQEFECTVEVVDDRGVLHRARPNHWWKV